MRKMFIFLILINSFSCFAQTISLGKNYNDKEINSIILSLDLLYEIKIEKKSILIYGEKKDFNHYYDEKLMIIKKADGKNIFNEGVYLQDNDSLFSFYKDDNTCSFMLRNIKNKNDPYNEFFLIKSDKNKIFRNKINEKFISSLVVLNNKIYYTTENDSSCLKYLNMNSGEKAALPFTSPNACLININNNIILGKTIDSKTFFIVDDKIIYTDDLFFEKDNLFKSFRKKSPPTSSVSSLPGSAVFYSPK